MFIHGIDGAVQSPAPVSDQSSRVRQISEVQRPAKLQSTKGEILDKSKEIKKLSEDRKSVEAIADSMSKLSESLNHKLTYKLDDRSPSGFVVRMVDSNDGKIIKEFPPEDFLNMVQKMHDFIGAFIDKRA